MLEIKNLIAGYVKDSPVLKGIDLSVGDNEVVGIIGQNGSGKSTLAKTIMNLVPYVSGEILFDGKDILGKNTHKLVGLGIGYFPQGGRIFPNLTVWENMEFACGKMNKSEKKGRLLEIREIFHIFSNGCMNLKASYLSGGEQHQLALAMVLIHKPQFIILDEPSAGLSPSNVISIYNYLFSYRKNYKLNVLLIEQNVEMAFKNSEKVMLLENGTITLRDRPSEDLKEQIINKYFIKGE